MSSKSKYLLDKTRKTGEPVTEDTPLLPVELEFIKNYIRLCNGTEAAKATGIQCSTESGYKDRAYKMLNKPNVKAEIKRIMDEIRKDTVATAEEVMSYFTQVMRGDIKDQFGLDAPLSERTRAAQEIAKRTVDLENRQKGTPDNVIAVKLDWGRD